MALGGQTVRQPKGQQRLPLPSLPQTLPAGGRGGPLCRFQAEMGREVPLAGVQQRIGLGPLAPIGQQRAIGALGSVVAARFQGIVDHQQHALPQSLATGLKPRFQARVSFRAPAGRTAGRRQIQGRQLRHLLGPQGGSGLESQGPLEIAGHLLPTPPRAIPQQAIHRQGIEHLMGDHHPGEGMTAQLLPSRPTQRQRQSTKGSLLPGRHAGVGLQEHHLRARGQIGPQAGQARRQLPRQVALPGPRLQQAETLAGELLQPFDQLGKEQGGKVVSQGRGGGEIPRGPDACPSAAVIAMLRVMEGPVHVGAEGHAAARGLEALQKPGRCRVSRGHGHAGNNGGHIRENAVHVSGGIHHGPWSRGGGRAIPGGPDRNGRDGLRAGPPGGVASRLDRHGPGR